MSQELFFDYHYGDEAEQYSFYRIPKILFKDKRFSGLSTDAKVLYGLMLDRMSLSMKNRWVDSENRVYIYFTLEDAKECIDCGKDKGIKLFSELDGDKGVGLIERKKQGLGKPTIIYVKNFISNAEVLTSEKPKSALLKKRSPECDKTEPSNTNVNKLNISDTDISINLSQNTENQGSASPIKSDGIEERKIHREIILGNIEYDTIKNRYEENMLLELVDIITDAVCHKRETLSIAGSEIPKEIVKNHFLKLKASHIEYVFECLKNNTTKVRNIKNYLLTSLYNAVLTIDHYYSAEVNHDFHQHRL